MYNLIEYSDNFSDSTDSLYQFKRQEPLGNNATLNNTSSSFKYKSGLLGNSANRNNNNFKTEKMQFGKIVELLFH